jgi:hypothetical protein
LQGVDTSTVRKQKDERDNAEFEAAEQRRSVAAKAKVEANSRMKEENAQRDRDLVTAKPDKKPEFCFACGHQKEEGVTGRYCEA